LRAFKIEIRGFKRLSNAACNVDGKMIAFLGPNEAGKSSVLQALSWFSEPDTPLAPRLATRGQTLNPSEPVVRVTYALGNEDRAAIDDLPMRNTVKSFTVAKYANGETRYGLQPQPSRNSEPIDEALASIVAIERIFPGEAEPENPTVDDDEVRRLLAVVQSFFENPDATWDADWDGDFNALIEWLDEPIRVDGGAEPTPRAPEAGVLISSAREIMRAAHPRVIARQRLHRRVPEFAFFDAAERSLSPSYDLSEEQFRLAPPSSLSNLLWLAELDLNKLWQTVEDSDTSRARTMERQANERLAKRLGPRWRQERLNVELNVSGTVLEVLIAEGHQTGATTAFDERSDGLRMFVALVAFLARREFELPPILLVDEIETHLHLDAQADLVEVLTNDVEATQVFYTTHSPGSLPRDLGTGIRLVQPDDSNRSVSLLRNDFWTSGPGFTPLLFAMGAGAAAFSALRKAVFCEGPSDMILLPSLFRLAIDQDDVGFQITQGISSYNGPRLELEEAAARVAYLLDGDEGGDNNRGRLEGMGIAPDRIVQLDADTAAEDYVLRSRYLEVVNTLLPGEEIRDEDLAADATVSRAVERWCEEHDEKPPGKTAVASALVRDREALTLAPGAKAMLAAVHMALEAALTATAGA
jgi:energy-coupling factor transporter ATP-binding protein EcfA2